jgi:hypothetical protein
MATLQISEYYFIKEIITKVTESITLTNFCQQRADVCYKPVHLNTLYSKD